MTEAEFEDAVVRVLDKIDVLCPRAPGREDENRVFVAERALGHALRHAICWAWVAGLPEDADTQVLRHQFRAMSEHRHFDLDGDYRRRGR